MSEKLLCEIFKSLKHDEMYLYVDKKAGFSRVPEALLNGIGKTSSVMTLILTPERKMARVKAEDVLVSIREKGYYLQMPPSKDELADTSMKEVGALNQLLTRAK